MAFGAGKGRRGRRDHGDPRHRHRQRAVHRRRAGAQHRARPPEDGQARRRAPRGRQRARDEDLSWKDWAKRAGRVLPDGGGVVLARPVHRRRRRQQEGRQVPPAPATCRPRSCPRSCSTRPASSAPRSRTSSAPACPTPTDASTRLRYGASVGSAVGRSGCGRRSRRRASATTRWRPRRRASTAGRSRPTARAPGSRSARARDRAR